MEKNFGPFMQAWFESGTIAQDKWKFVINRQMTELENFGMDYPYIPALLAKCLIMPLLAQGKVQLGDIQWFKEEDKDELFDVSGQMKIAALILQAQVEDGKQTQQQVAADFKKAHNAAFEILRGAFEDDKNGFKEDFIEKDIKEDYRAFVISTLGIE